MAKLVMEIYDDGAISWTRPAAQSEIDAAATEQIRLDAEVGRAIREYFARIEGRYLVSAKMEISVHRYDSQGIAEAHWNIHACVTIGYEHREEELMTDGRLSQDNPELRDALIAAGLLKVTP